MFWLICAPKQLVNLFIVLNITRAIGKNIGDLRVSLEVSKKLSRPILWGEVQFGFHKAHDVWVGGFLVIAQLTNAE